MSVTNTEWDDIPTSSELFGGDFFGDELMEMYTADHGLNLGGASSAIISTSSSGGGGHPDQEDESNHPGVLIAMNAAAMDGGLSPLGSTPEFVPHMAVSDGSSKLPAYPTLSKAQSKKKKSKGGVASSTVASCSSSVVATAAAVAAASNAKGGKDLSNVSQGVVTRKRKGAASQAPTATKKTAIVTRKAAATMAAAATTQVTKKVVPPSAPKVSTRSSAAAAASQVSKTASGKASTLPTPAATIAKTGGVRAPASVLKKQPAAVPTAVKSSGGITHQVARPSAVPSSTVGSSATQRIAPPTTTTTSRPTGYAKTTVSVSSTGVKRASSEADFKDVASAAVTSLIQNASSTLKTGTKPIPKVGEKPVDVSTAHINALTSQNWVTACNPIPTPTVSAADAAEKAARNARRATLTQEERAKQNRDRNREHARNTRLRKKAYVEELKRTLTELVARRDAADLEKRHEAQRNREQREVRFRVMEEFLKLRGRNELSDARWVAILEDGFVLTLPKTSFRKMVDVDTKASSKDNDGENDSSDTTHSSLDQALRGATQVMEDSAHLSAYLQTIGGSVSTESGDSKVELTYRCDRKHFFMDGNIAFMDFTATTVGVVAKGASSEVVYKGQIRSSFSPASNKLISVDCTFDTASFIQQVEALSDVSSSKAAAAAHEADALLDSLQMPHFADKKEDEKAAISVSSDDGEIVP